MTQNYFNSTYKTKIGDYIFDATSGIGGPQI